MEIIKQTNRTMIFDQINPEKLGLLTLVGDPKGLESLDDDKIKEINSFLLVNSFQEFLDKFEPTIYTFFNANTQGVDYTLTRPKSIPADCVQEIPLNNHHQIIKMLKSMIQEKGSVGLENVDFDFKEVLSLLSPEKVMRQVEIVRKDIDYLYGKYLAIEDESPEKPDIGDKLNAKLDEARTNYQNIQALLPLAIDDCKARLLEGANRSAGDGEKFVPGKLTMDENGKLIVKELPPPSENTALSLSEESDPKTQLMTIFKNDYEEESDDPNPYVADLVARVFCPLAVTTPEEIDVEAEIEKYNGYMDFYKRLNEGLVKTAKPLLEKILGVYIFFEQYRTKKGMKPSMLICNELLEDIVSSNGSERFKLYLRTINSKNDFRNTIWFGLVSNVVFNSDAGGKEIKSVFMGNKKVVRTDLISMNRLATLLNLVKDFRIQIFFSFESSEDTSFSSLATKGVEPYMDKTEMLEGKEYSTFAIPCLPNMSVIPKNKSGVVLGKLIERTENGGAKLSETEKGAIKLWVEGVYIPACYVAAGVVAAYQCPEYLRERFAKSPKAKVSRDYPGVRFNIEASDHALWAPTTLGKEISGYTSETKKAINKNSYGFVFSSDNYKLGDRDINNITVYKARCLGTTPTGEYEGINIAMAGTYIMRMLQARSRDFELEGVKAFFSANSTSQKSVWVNNQNCINSIYQPGDILDCVQTEIGTYQTIVSLGGNVVHIDIELQASAKLGA